MSSKVRLSRVAQGRDNNFNLIRFVAAFAVLVSHSFALFYGPVGMEPLQARLGYTLGEIAVDVFFASSGFLVTGSLLRLQHPIRFLRARALRIYPALLVLVCLTVFLLGPAFTSEPIDAYFSSLPTFQFLLRNSLVLAGIEHDLPGVFEANPWQGTVNGSLWTLPFELFCYLGLVVAWIWQGRNRFPRLRLTPGVAVATAGTYLLYQACRLHGLEVGSVFRLCFMFLSGVLFYLAKDRVTLRAPVAFGLGAALLLAARDPVWFGWVYPACVTYLTLCAAYLPAGRIRHFNRLGDYSYGIYIYAFPVQQMLVASVSGLTVWRLVGFAAAITLPLAALSWYVVEKPALALK